MRAGSTRNKIIITKSGGLHIIAVRRRMEQGNSNMQFIVPVSDINNPLILPDEVKIVDENYQIRYYDNELLPPLSLRNYLYPNIPKCLRLCDNLAGTGIINLQNQPNLQLKGRGVAVAIIDTGINYMDSAFTDEYGNSRILFYYDQETGQEYTNADIDNANRTNESGRSDVVIPQDTNGHGTFLASVACGREDPVNGFVGAAPEASLIVVKLKPADSELRQFFFIPDNEEGIYAESDIMLAVSYCERKAAELKLPLAICLGMGTNNGDHNGDGFLCDYLNSVAADLMHAVVIAAGNEALAKHHFRGRAQSVLEPERVEIDLDNDSEGFYLECWCQAPELVRLSIQSPTGEIWPRSMDSGSDSMEHVFIFENTTVSIDYNYTGRQTRDLIIFVRFTKPTKGIWTLRVFPEYSITGIYDIWLPANGMLKENAVFIRSDPDITLTSPSDAAVPITVGGYNNGNNSVYLDSGRGFKAGGGYKPDFVASAVEIMGKELNGSYGTRTGTSMAAAITTGASAQILEWLAYRRNAQGANSVDVKYFITRGCVRREGQVYPSITEGYGVLNIYNSFQNLF